MSQVRSDRRGDAGRRAQDCNQKDGDLACSVFTKSLCRLQIIRIETLGGSSDTCAA